MRLRWGTERLAAEEPSPPFLGGGGGGGGGMGMGSNNPASAASESRPNNPAASAESRPTFLTNAEDNNYIVMLFNVESASSSRHQVIID